MTIGLDAMEEGYVNAIKTLLEIKLNMPNSHEFISDQYADNLAETLKELRP